MTAPMSDEEVPEQPWVLLVEDNVVNQHLAELYIRRLGYAYDTVSSGREAVEAAAQKAYVLILMDCQMPGMDGLEATRLIRHAEGQSGRHVPIVALTANTFAIDRASCLDAGMDDYLAKPLDAKKLAYVVSHWVERSTPPGQTEVKLETGQMVVSRASIDTVAFAKLRRLLTHTDPDFLAKSIDSFLNNTTQLIASLRLSVERQETNEVYRTAHTLKSSSASYCAPGLSALCRDLEASARGGSLDGALQQIAQIEAEFANVRRALEAERN